MESEIYYINMDGNIYFEVEDSVVCSQGKQTSVSPDKLSDFLAIAKELYCCPLKLFIQNKLGLTLLTKYQPF